MLYTSTSTGGADLVVIIRAQDQITRELAQVKRQLETLTSSTKRFSTETTREVQRADKAFRGMSQTLIKLGAALGGLYAFRLAFREIVQPAIEFDQALRQIWTITDATWGEMRKLGTELRRMAREFGKSADEVAWGFYEIKSSGFEGADALKVLEASIKGAAAGLASVNEVADVTTSILNAWGMSADQAARVNDILFKTVDLGKVKIHDLAQEFGRLAGIAAPLGVGLVELAAAVSTLTIQGVQANEAVTAIRQAVIQLAKPTKTTAEVIRALGYESGAAMVQQLGFAQALAEVTQYAEEHNIELTKMFTNIRAVLAILPLATTSAATYARHQQLIANATGKVDEAFGKMAGGIQHKIDLLKAAVTDFEISLSENLIEPITHLIELLTALADVLGLVAKMASLGGHALSNLLMGGGLYKLVSRFFPGAASWLAPLVFTIPTLLQYKIDVEAELAEAPESVWSEIGDALRTGIGPALAAAALAALKGAGLAGAATAGLVAGVGAAVLTLLVKVVFEFTAAEETTWQELPEYVRRLRGLEVMERGFEEAATPFAAVLGENIVSGISKGLDESIWEKYSPLLERASEIASSNGLKAGANKLADMLRLVLPESFEEQAQILAVLLKGVGSDFASAVLDSLGIGVEELRAALLGIAQQAGDAFSSSLTLPGLAGTEPPPLGFTQIQPTIDDFIRRIQEMGLTVQQSTDAVRQAWDQVIAAIGTEEYKDAFDAFWQTLRDATPDVHDLVDRVRDLGAEVRGQPQVLRDLYNGLVDVHDEIEANIPALQFFRGSAEDAEAEAQYLASALGLAADAALDLAARLSEIQVSQLGTAVGDINEILTAIQTGVSPEGEPLTFGELANMIGQFQAGAQAVLGVVNFFEQWGNTENEIYRQAKDLLDYFRQQVPGLELKTWGERKAEQAAREAQRAAERAAREAERAAREAARRAQEAFREQFTAPIEAAVSTGDWLAAAVAIKAFAQNKDALMAQAAALPEVNGRTIEQSEVLRLITGAYRKLLSTLDDQIEVMKLAGENTEALEKMRDAIEALLDPMGILKQRLRELVAQAREYPVEVGQELRRLALGTQTGLEIEAAWGELSEQIQDAVGGAIDRGIAEPIEGQARVVRRCYGDYCEVIRQATEETSSCLSGYCGAVQEAAQTTRQVLSAVPDTGYYSCTPYPSSGDLPCGLPPTDLYITHMKMLIAADEEFARRFWKVSGIAREMASAMQDGVMTQAELNEVYRLAEGDLSLIADAAREVVDALEQEIEDRELLGMETTDLRKRLAALATVLTGLPPELARLRGFIHEFGNDLKGLIAELLPGGIGETAQAGIDLFSTAMSVNWADMATAAQAAEQGMWAVAAEAFASAGGLGLLLAAIQLAKKTIDVLSGWMKEATDRVRELGEVACRVAQDAFEQLRRQSHRLATSFSALIKAAEPYVRLQKALSEAFKRIFDVLLGFLWPLVAVLEKLFGSAEKASERLGELNVPVGYKVERNVWRAARPGEPPAEEEPGQELPPWVEEIIKAFKEFLDQIAATLKEFFDTLIGIWKELGPALLEAILPAIQWLAEGLLGLAKLLEDALPQLLEFLPQFFAGLADFFAGLLLGIATLFIETLLQILPNLAAFGEALGRIGKLLPELFSALADAVAPVLATFLDALTAVANWIADVLIPDLITFFEAFGEWWKAEVDPFLKQHVFPQLAEWFGVFYDWLKQELIPFLRDEVWPFLKNDFWPVFVEVVNGVVEALQELWQTVKDNWPTIKELLIDQFREWVRKWIARIDLAAAYIELKSGDLMGALFQIWTSESISLWDKIKYTFGFIAQWIFDTIGKAFKYLGRVLRPVWEGMKQIATIIGTLLRPVFEAMGALLKITVVPLLTAVGVALQVFGEIIKFVANGLTALYNYVLRPIINIGITFANALIGLFNAISNFIKTITFGKVDLGHIEPIEALPELPYLQEGGRILREGLAYLHAGETVVPAQVQPLPVAPPQRIVVHTHVHLDGKEIADTVHEYESRENVRLVAARQGTAFRRR